MKIVKGVWVITTAAWFSRAGWMNNGMGVRRGGVVDESGQESLLCVGTLQLQQRLGRLQVTGSKSDSGLGSTNEERRLRRIGCWGGHLVLAMIVRHFCFRIKVQAIAGSKTSCGLIHRWSWS